MEPMIIHYCIHENPPWDPVIQRLTPTSICTSFMHNIHVKIIIPLLYLSWGTVTNIFCAFLIFSFMSFSCYCHSTNVPFSYFGYLPPMLFQQLSASLYKILYFLHMSYMGPSYPILFNHLTWYWHTVTSISNIWQRQLFWYRSYINPSLYFKGEIPKITLWKMWQYSV